MICSSIVRHSLNAEFREAEVVLAGLKVITEVVNFVRCFQAMSWSPLPFYEDHLLPGEEFTNIAYDLVGEEVQRLSVVNSLPTLLSGSDCSLCMQRIVPKILLALDKASKEFHVASALTFYTILEKKLIHPRTYSQTFLRSMVDNIDFKVPEVASIWLDVLLDAVLLLPVDIIRSEIVPVAIVKSQISQIVGTRIKACRMLGKCSLRLDKFYLKKEILPVILSLCQDINHEVRACICSELSSVIKSVDNDVAKSTLLPTMVELASDEETSVRIAAVSTVVEVLPHFGPDSIKGTVVPLVKKLCNQSMNTQDDCLVSISFQVGKLALGLEHHMNLAEKQWLLSYYRDMAHLGAKKASNDRRNFPMPDFNMMGSADRVILCRQNCAYNFPAMAIFCTKLGEAAHEQLYSTFCNLITDPYFMVRRTIACGFHEVTSVLGASCGMVKTELAKLLRDDVEEVLHGLIPNLAKSMEQLAKYGALGPDNMDAQSLEIGRAILKCESEINETHNWRLHSTLMSQLECLPLCLPSEFLHNYFIPIIFSRIHKSRAVPCRVAAARTLLVFLRYNPKAPQRNDLRIRIINDFCRGRSCFARMAFAKLCGSAMDIFSRRYFKEHFFMQLLELSDDKVANVRMQFVSHLPRLKAMLRLPADKKLLLNLEACVRKLAANETDRDVKTMLSSAMKELERIAVREEGAGAMPLSREDVEDQRKVDEENKFSSAKAESVRKRNVDVSKNKFPATGSTAPLRAGTGYNTRRGIGTRPDKDGGRTSSSVATRTRVGAVQSSPVLRPSTLASLEDEFYVDAGIRIPHQLAVSGELPSYPLFPSRIPNLEEILFKNQNPNQLNHQLAVSGELPSSPLFPSRIPNLGEILFKNQNPNQLNMCVTCPTLATISVSYSVTERPLNKPETSTLTSSVCENAASSEAEGDLKQNPSNGVFIEHNHSKGLKNMDPSNNTMKGSNSEKQNVDFISETEEKTIPPGKTKRNRSSEQKQRIPSVVNRRHSYMEGDKGSKSPVVVNKTENSVIKERGSSFGSRRHSYIDKISTDGKNIKPAFVTAVVSHNTYVGDRQTNSSAIANKDLSNKKSIPHKSINSENKDLTKINVDIIKRRGFVYLPQQDRSRVNSVVKRKDFEATDSSLKEKVSQIPKHPQSFSVAKKRSRSSLERDDLEKLRSPLYQISQSFGIQRRSLRSSLESMHSLNPSDFQKSQKQYCISQSKIDEGNSQHNTTLDSTISSDDNLDLMLKKRNRLSLSKIPRGSASCHSSPCSSRASSPTGLVSNSVITTKQRTAPNSRSTSPTDGSGSCGIRRPQRLSLGSLNSYMSNLKLHESHSRLPIRKPPP